MKKNNVFTGDIHMETQTIFCQNGNINIYPCTFELGQHITLGADRASQKGRMVTEHDGTSHFRAYAKDSFKRYRQLFRTAHGGVKETRGSVIFELRFPKRLGRTLIEALFREETQEQEAFIRTRRTETQW